MTLEYAKMSVTEGLQVDLSAYSRELERACGQACRDGSGLDLHTHMAKWLFKTDAVTSEQRKAAKRLNYPVLYSQGRRGKSMTFAEARRSGLFKS